MKCLCFSDSHGFVGYFRKALELHPDCEVVFFLGDGLSDAEMLASHYRNTAWLMVRGNCDYSSIALGAPVEKTSSITLMDKRIVFTHGDLYGVKYGEEGLLRLAESRGADIVLFGHTHIPYEKYIPNEKGVYLFNPGSIGAPSYDKGASYGIIDLTEKGISFSHGSFV